MGAIVIYRHRPVKVLSGVQGGTEFIPTDQNTIAFAVVTLEDGDLSLVKRGKRTIVNATQNKVILSDDSVKLTVASNSVLDIRINDSFEVYGEIYRINQEPVVKKLSESNYSYEIVGQGLMFDMTRVRFFNADGSGFKTSPSFPLIGTIETFLLMLKANMQRLSIDWEIGTFSNGETKTITFSEDTCLSALQKICQEFKTEFWVKYEGGKYVIHTGEFGSTVPVVVQYGKGKGLYDLTRKNVNEDGIINRLYVSGGTQNIRADYRGYSDRLKFSDDGYIEDAALVEAQGLKEGSIIFEDIYPHRTGSITTATSVFKFIDSSMDFDLNEKNTDGSTKYLISGQTAKIHFNTGNLAGYQFEIKSYDHATKEFEIIQFDNQNGQKFPDEATTAFQFAVGDEYVLLDINMPDSYVTNAETELLTKGTEQFNLLKQAKVSYELNLAQDFLKTLSTPIQIGDLIRVLDTALGIDKTLRINSITRNFIKNGEVDDFDIKAVIADSYEIAFSSQLVLDITDIRNIIHTQKIDQLRLSKIGLQVTDDLKNSIFDPDGKLDTGIIRENSIEANMLAIGSRSQAISTNLFFQTNVGMNPNAVAASAFILFSQSLEKQWSFPSFSQTIPTNALRYVYAKVNRTGTDGTLLISTEQILYESDPSYLHIVLGILSSVVDGVRIFVPTYGATTITGGTIRTGIISDELGSFQINLNTGTITADRITFKASDNTYKDLTDAMGAIDTNLTELNATRDYVDGLLQDELDAIHNQLDGVVDDWYLQHSPTLSNLPASDWTTIAMKRDHVGDRFTNTEPFVDEITTPDSGKQWRFIETSTNVFEWVLIPNSESAIALTRANEAFDLADGKRRIFVAQPTTPYDIGDLWTQGSGGDIMRCKTARTSGSFVAADWKKASKYTDDSTALLIEATLNTSIANSLQAAKDYSDAELDAREITIKAYADGQVTASENRSILDATSKANAAKAYADAQDLLLKTQMEAYADGAVSDEEAARIAQATANLAAAKAYADAQANAAQVASNAYADGIVSDEEARAIADADDKLVQAKQYADALQTATEAAMMIYADGKVDALEAEMLTNIDNSLAAAKSYADAQDSLSLITAKAYTDGEVSAEEARAIADATAKADAAKLYAEAQDLLLKAQMEAYADGIISDEEAARIQAIKNAADAAKEYTDNQAILSKIASEAYADGIVDEAERLAIEEAQKAAELARLKTIELLGGMTIGAKNLLREYDLRFDFKYWGNSGTSEEIDLNAIEVVEGFALGGMAGTMFAYTDENGKILELTY